MEFTEPFNSHLVISFGITEPGPLFTKKMPSYGYRDPHDKPKMDGLTTVSGL